MKDFFIENKFLVILWILSLVALLIFVGHYSGLLIDFGREVYYPEQILNGKILYKDGKFYNGFNEQEIYNNVNKIIEKLNIKRK